MAHTEPPANRLRSQIPHRPQDHKPSGCVISIDEQVSLVRLVSVVTPMFNEESKIADSLAKLLRALERLPFPWELILVNDGSTDHSLQVAEPLLSMRDNSTIISYSKNRGRGHALRQGFARARGDVVVATESDLSWGEDIVERLVERLVGDRLDVVVASPHAAGGRLESVPLARHVYTRVGNRILGLLMPVRLSMYTGMTRAYRREVLDSLDLESDDKELHLEILAKAASLGYRIGEIPATLAWTPDRKRRRSSFRARRYVVSHLLFGMGEAPLLLLTSASALLVLVGLASGAYLLTLSVSGVPVGGRPLIQFAALSIVVGLFVLLFGLIAHQNKRLERQTHRLLRAIREQRAREHGE